MTDRRSFLRSAAYTQDGKVTQIDSEVSKTYGYDDAFRITGITDSSNAALSWTYGYDDLDRLTSASKTGTTLGYTYDANGNRLTQIGTSASTFTVAANSNRLSSTSGALTRTYGYDNAGNTTSFTGVAFAYNNRGRMSSSTKSSVTTNYVYNALGQLVKKGTNTLYYYDEAGHILGTYSGTGVLVEEIVWMGDIPIVSLRPKATGGINIYNIHTDHLNTPRLITGSVNPGIRWRWDSDPFGVGVANNNPSGVGAFDFHLRFPGQMYVAETGLNYNYFRDYDPGTGKYVQSDPLGLPGGLNTYAYVGGNPIRYIDPYGLTCTSNYDFFWDWWFQRGSSSRRYGPDDLENREMKQSPGASYMREQFKSGGCRNIKIQGYGTMRAYFETFTSPCSTEFQVGGFVWSAINVGSCQVRYRAYNQASLYSFFLHIPGIPHADRSTVNHGGNIDQVFEWIETSPCASAQCCSL